MTPEPPRSLAAFLGRYACACWPSIGALVVLSVVGNILAVAQPMILAAILAALLKTPPSAPGGLGLFNLNILGDRLVGSVGRWVGSPEATLPALAGLLVVQAALSASGEYGAQLCTVRIKLRTTADVQRDLVRHLLSLDLPFFHGRKAGELMSRLMQDAAAAAQALGPLIFSVIYHGVRLLAYGCYLFSTSVPLSFGALSIVGLHFTLARVMRRSIWARARGVSQAQADVAASLQEAITSVRVIKSFGAEEAEGVRQQRVLQQQADAVWRQSLVERLEPAVRAVIDAAGMVVILLIAAAQMRAGRLTAQGLLLYLYVGRLVIAPAGQMASTYLWMQGARGSFEEVRRLFGQRPLLRDGAHLVQGFGRALELRDVSFAYGRTRVLEGLTVAVDKGQMVAIVGPSGSGKSTLADLLLRLYDPQEGRITLDGVDIRELSVRSYRSLFGVVPQEPWLFHGTVGANILYGRSGFSQEAVERAAQIANAHRFITQLPRGYDTVIGDRGVKLSGGERQRISLARALLHRPAILILDEATSSLDSESERQVQEAIGGIVGKTTAVVIAHRLSTVQAAHRIVVLEQGKIAAIGRHDELLVASSLYRRLCALQFDFPLDGFEPADGLREVGKPAGEEAG